MYKLERMGTHRLTLPDEVWLLALNFARRNGSRPVGTKWPTHADLPEPPAGWDGSYINVAGQLVIEQDAKNLANALRKSLPSLTGEEPSHREELEQLQAFCQLGGFSITHQTSAS